MTQQISESELVLMKMIRKNEYVATVAEAEY